MEVDLIFKIAGIGLIVAVLQQMLSKAGRDEFATLTVITGIVVIIAILLITLITDYIVLATFTTITVSPIFLAYHQQNYYIGLIVGIASLVILYKHRANIVRLLNGTEMGLRKAHKGEYR